jgi:hypothetical protein
MPPETKLLQVLMLQLVTFMTLYVVQVPNHVITERYTGRYAWNGSFLRTLIVLGKCGDRLMLSLPDKEQGTEQFPRENEYSEVSAALVS